MYASKNSGPYRCPRGYRGGTAAGVRSNTFILRAAGSRANGHPRADRKIARTATTVMAAPVLITRRQTTIIFLIRVAFNLPTAFHGLTAPLDIRAATAYYPKYRSGSRRLPLKIQGTAQDRSFLIRVGAIKALRPSKGQEPAGANFSHRDLSRRTGYPVRQIPY